MMGFMSEKSFDPDADQGLRHCFPFFSFFYRENENERMLCLKRRKILKKKS
jgi:hypothetical protein